MHQDQVKRHITLTDSPSWRPAPPGAHDQILVHTAVSPLRRLSPDPIHQATRENSLSNAEDVFELLHCMT
jgi:hypothetical protein